MLRICFVMLSLSMSLISALQTALAADSPQDAYEAKAYQGADGQTLPYRVLTPEKIEPGKTYPLVLFLHGAGERGTDNASQIIHYFAAELLKPEHRREYPCFVVCPQCPTERRWVEVDWALPSHAMPEKPSLPLGLALELVDKLAGELPVDKGRIYVTGLSMGGFGTWDAIQRRPAFFAAAIPICGGGDTAEASKLKNVPIWAFHGDKDRSVMPSRTERMIEAIWQAGGKPKMTIYPGVEHNSWTATYADPEVWACLFAQKRPR
jgi:predicted peptidase